MIKSLQTKNFLLEKDVVLERKALVEEERVRDLTIRSSNTQQVPTLTRVVLGDGPSFGRAQAWSPLLWCFEPTFLSSPQSSWALIALNSPFILSAPPGAQKCRFSINSVLVTRKGVSSVSWSDPPSPRHPIFALSHNNWSLEQWHRISKLASSCVECSVSLYLLRFCSFQEL